MKDRKVFSLLCALAFVLPLTVRADGDRDRDQRDRDDRDCRNSEHHERNVNTPVDYHAALATAGFTKDNRSL